MISEKELARIAANAYKRDWAKRNPKKIKAAQQKYWAKRAAQMVGMKDEAKTNTTDDRS